MLSEILVGDTPENFYMTEKQIFGTDNREYGQIFTCLR